MYRPYQNINRRKSRSIIVGNVKVGDNSPISVQTMTNTLTHNIDSTLSQIERVKNVGADIVRVSVPDKESSKALKKICKKSKIPIIADVHFHYKRAIESAINGAACLRINPGNIGSSEKIKDVIKAANGLQKKIHPDVNPNSNTERLRQIVNEAKETILKFDFS